MQVHGSDSLLLGGSLLLNEDVLGSSLCDQIITVTGPADNAQCRPQNLNNCPEGFLADKMKKLTGSLACSDRSNRIGVDTEHVDWTTNMEMGTLLVRRGYTEMRP